MIARVDVSLNPIYLFKNVPDCELKLDFHIKMVIELSLFILLPFGNFGVEQSVGRSHALSRLTDNV